MILSKHEGLAKLAEAIKGLLPATDAPYGKASDTITAARTAASKAVSEADHDAA